MLVESVGRGRGGSGSERDARMKDAEVDVALLKPLQALRVQYSRAASIVASRASIKIRLGGVTGISSSNFGFGTDQTKGME